MPTKKKIGRPRTDDPRKDFTTMLNSEECEILEALKESWREPSYSATLRRALVECYDGME